MSEAVIRPICFLAVLAAMATWEALAPRRPRMIGRAPRWPSNLGIVLLNTLIVRLLFPLTAMEMGDLAAIRGWGLFNLAAIPAWITVPTAVVLLDMAIYGQHVAFHYVPPLWRLHRMHHTDQEFDVTTGLRFHPVEIVLSMAIKLVVVAALGAPPLAVLIFEVLLNATAMFNHANLNLPIPCDAVLRRIVVTPDMHRVHHSLDMRETNSNFGFNLPWWDRLFGTYLAQPASGHLGMTIGIEAFRNRGQLRLDRMLTQPLRRAGGRS